MNVRALLAAVAMAPTLAVTISRAYDVVQLPGATGRISGRVVDVVTGRPVTSAQVNCGRAGTTNDRFLVGDNGSFSCDRATAGVYALETSRVGYLHGGYGWRRPSGGGRTITLRPGERRDGIVIELWPYGSISGEVTDEAGNPLPGVMVTAVSMHEDPLRPRSLDSPPVTDDRGRYEIGSLLPGTYVVGAIMQYGAVRPDEPGAGLFRPPAPPVAPGSTSTGWTSIYGSTFWRESMTLGGAVPIAIGAGDQRGQIDLHLQLRPAVTISGRAVGTAGPVGGAFITVAAAREDARAGVISATARTAADGSFNVPMLPSGTYRLEGQLTRTAGRLLAPELRLWGSTAVSTADGSSGIVLPLASGVTVKGRLAFAGSAPAAADPSTRVILDVNGLGMVGSIAADGTFAIRGVPPGRAFLRLPEPSRWSVESIRHQGRDVLDVPVDITDEDVDDLIVTLTDRPASLSGRVTVVGNGKVEDAAVIVFPAEASMWSDLRVAGLAVRLREPFVEDDGSFRISALPPGEYLAIALDDRAIESLPRPGVFQALAAAAERITIRPSSAHVLSLSARIR
jgi:hypothetical protein